MERSTRNVLLAGVAGFVLGKGLDFVQSLWIPGLPRRFAFGIPELFAFGIPELMGLSFFLIYVAFWGLMIVAVWRGIRWLGRERYDRRLADLPADFDDWHRRAHAQMEREAATRTGQDAGLSTG